MDIKAEKASIIKQFMQIDDINLIIAIKSLLNFARYKEKTDDEMEIPEHHKEIVRSRIKEYENSFDSYLTMEQIEERITSKK